MIWPVTEQQQREEIKKTWSIFPTGINDPIHLRALWPKRLPGKKAARNIVPRQHQWHRFEVVI